ncbi:hypothetical protein DE146DRAFT_223438 [Phaeosphaeria sp. MPI-PUGE-AT-0046c]|nr:hypothetical protein DE146DRAFT_223438 [Phaeosphaeria sp. MPI-PUGE-AT-0046c]
MEGGVLESIPYAQKAANVCSYCRVRKQKCDRNLPKCSRCAGLGRICDYSPYKPPAPASEEIQPLVLHHQSYQSAELSSRGKIELLQNISACTDPFELVDPETVRLWGLIERILNLAEFDLTSALREFASGMHKWCPVLDENMLPDGDNDLSKNARRHPLFTLCMWFVATSIGVTEVYRAMKHIFVALQTDFEIRVEAVQIGVLIAMYEVSHGLQAQANYTVSTCAIMVQYLEPASPPDSAHGQAYMLKRLKSSLLRLDRVNHLLAPTQHQPLSIPSTHPIPTSLTQNLGPLPPIAEFEFASSPRTHFFRTLVSVVSGRVYTYIHARSHGMTPAESYEDVNGAIHDIIGMLDGGPPADKALQCASYPMLVCSHILLQYIEHQVHTHTGRDEGFPDISFVAAGLQLSRVMVWNMLRVAIRMVRTESDVIRIPFAALCAVLRGAIVVLETRRTDQEDVVTEEDVTGLKRVLNWFTGRWGIGGAYLVRIEQLLV